MTDKGKTVLLSLVADDAPVQLAPEPDVQVIYVEAAHKAVDEDGCDAGDWKGDAWIEETNMSGKPDKFRGRMDFVLEGGGITVHGVGDKGDGGTRTGTFCGRGWGAYESWVGCVTLDVCNPKRWVFEPGIPGI